MTAGYISQVENEISQPSDRTVEAICGAYSISPEWLKRGIDMPDLLDIGNRYQLEREQLPERVRTLRKMRGLSQNAFADRLGFSTYHVKAIEMGRVSASGALLQQIAVTFNVSLQWLRTGNGEMEETITEKKERLTHSELLTINEYMENNDMARKAVLHAMKCGADIWTRIDEMLGCEKQS